MSGTYQYIRGRHAWCVFIFATRTKIRSFCFCLFLMTFRTASSQQKSSQCTQSSARIFQTPAKTPTSYPLFGMDPSSCIDLSLKCTTSSTRFKIAFNSNIDLSLGHRFGRVRITTQPNDESPQCHRNGAVLLNVLGFRSSFSCSTQPPSVPG